MTKQEFMEKYGNEKVVFDSYYKYTFTFRGVTQTGDIILVKAGGNADDIYRFEVTVGTVLTIADIDPYSGKVFIDGEIVEQFYDY